MTSIRIQYFSDILCVWAYIAERRVTELVNTFGNQIEIEPRFCSVFPNARGKIEANWKDRGGYDGFSRHLSEVATKFPHVAMSDRLWLDTRPRTSASAHLFIKAVEAIEHDDRAEPAPYLERISTITGSALRRAFFADARDISDWREHRSIARELGIDYDRVRDKIISSEAVAALATDMNLAQEQGIKGSPTFVMNNGRQKLFGNVGYRLLEVNVEELLRNETEGEASWC